MKLLRQPQERKLTEIVTSYIARDLYLLAINSRIPTIEDYIKLFSVSRGTVQNAIGNIRAAKGATLSGKGVAGAYIMEKNPDILLEMSGRSHFMGGCGIPQTKPLIAITSALYLSAKEDITISYVQGAQRRIKSLLAGKLDFIVASFLAGKELQNEYGQSLTIAKQLANKSYLTGYNLLIRKDIDIKEIKKIGFDPKSPDYRIITRKFFPEDKYTMVHMHYSSLPTALRNGKIDACIFNRDIAETMSEKIDYDKWGIAIKELDFKNMEMEKVTRAVIICSKDDYRTADFIRDNFDWEKLEKSRKAVLDDAILPIL